jgi:hypothetical protein
VSADADTKFGLVGVRLAAIVTGARDEGFQLHVADSETDESFVQPAIRLPFTVKLTLPSVPAGLDVATMAVVVPKRTRFETETESVGVAAVTVTVIAVEVDVA